MVGLLVFFSFKIQFLWILPILLIATFVMMNYKVQTTDIVYHFGRDKVSIARRMKVSHLGRVKMSHP